MFSVWKGIVIIPKRSAGLSSSGSFIPDREESTEKKEKIMSKPNTIKRSLAIALIMCMVLTMPLGVMASEQEIPAAVTEAGDSTVKINLLYAKDGWEEDEAMVIQTCIGFMVSDRYAVTCNHAIELDQGTLDFLTALFDISEDALYQNCFIRVQTGAGSDSRADVALSDEQADLAVLLLDNELSGCTGLPIRSAEDLEAEEDCYALWHSFAEDAEGESDTVMITRGEVQGFSVIDDTEYLVYNPDESVYGVGGPLVDDSGSLIGIIAGASEEDSCAITSDALICGLDSLGVSYIGPGDGFENGESFYPSQRPFPSGSVNYL